MKQTAFLILAATLLLVSCNNSSDDKSKSGADSTTTTAGKDDKKEAPLPDSVMKKNWEAYMTPGDVHKMMASWDGTWNSEVTMWEKPGAEPQKSVGSCVNKMVLGGRYQESVHHGDMAGMPFEGHSTLGYDNIKKVFQSIWEDNMGTGIMMMEGTWDAATKTATFTGKGMDPMTAKEKDYKETFNVIDDNTQMMAMYAPGPDGKEWKMMEIKFTRKK